MWIPLLTCPADILRKVFEVCFSDKLRDYAPGMHYRADKTIMRKGTFQVLVKFIFFNRTKIIFTAASAGIYQPPYNLPPYVLSCSMQSHITYHWGVLSFNCRIMSLSLKTIRNFFYFTKTETCPDIGSYSSCASKKDIEGKCILYIYLLYIFIYNMYIAILYLRNIIHGEIQYRYKIYIAFLTIV